MFHLVISIFSLLFADFSEIRTIFFFDKFKPSPFTEKAQSIYSQSFLFYSALCKSVFLNLFCLLFSYYLTTDMNRNYFFFQLFNFSGLHLCEIGKKLVEFDCDLLQFVLSLSFVIEANDLSLLLQN